KRQHEVIDVFSTVLLLFPEFNFDFKFVCRNSETLLHFLKGCLGTGILAMPKAFYHSGYLVGIIATVLIGGICTYCIHMLIRAEYELCKRRKVPSLTYHEVAEIAFLEGPPKVQKYSIYAKHAVNIFLLIYQLGICCVYVVFIGTNVKSVCDTYFPEMSVSIYMLMFLLPLILINWVRNLKRLAPFCTAANVITLIGYAIIFYYIIRNKPSFDNRSPTGQYDHFPLFFGTVLFSLEAIGVIMPLENEMKSPKNFARPFGVLNIGMGLVVSIYLIMGLLGYLSYGADVEPAITLNLPPDD
ncbi:proton-coupled amino acid transporter-like protein CG1139, partial [Agrilus planipennis]|uniref:Proton-coupled amino acid transporter-like protein CG1139 n=1 Tax=Agrilus planipennis TaxID=224129 RepID=A0A7F5RG32_AGRPL